MFAVIRVNLPNSPAGNMWSDAITRGFMDETIPFSLAHFWKETTFGQVDMRYIMFPPISVTLPQPPAPATMWPSKEARRAAWVSAVINEHHRVANPDWNGIDRCIIFFATAGTDVFAGGPMFTPGLESLITVAVFSSDSRFGVVAQEVGHALGLNHEWNADGTIEYGCPYSIMSAASDLSFERPFDSRLPGTMAPSDPPRIAGPLIPAAHLYINERRPVNPNAVFNHADSVTYVSVDYAESPQRVQLVARDAAIAAWPVRRPVLAVIPPVIPGGDTHFLELRRPGTGYERGFANASVIVLAGNFFNGSTAVSDPSTILLKYIGRLDLTLAEGDLDFRAPDGGFVAKIQSVAPNFETVDLTIASGGGPGSYGVRLGEGIETRTRLSTSGWTFASVRPCRIYPVGLYQYQTTTFDTVQKFTARSLGFEQPRYTWYVNDVNAGSLPGAEINVSAMCRRYDSGEVKEAEPRTVACFCDVRDNTLRLTVSEALYDVDLTVRVVVSERAPNSAAPERAAVVTARCGNIDVEWDQAFQTARANCLRVSVELGVGGVGVGETPGEMSPAEIRAATLRMLGIGVPMPDFLIVSPDNPT